MVRFLLALFLLLPISASALTVGPVGTISVGGLTLSTAGLKILKTSLSSNSYSVFYDNSLGGTPAIYQVPGGKTFKLYAVRLELLGASATTLEPSLMYADTQNGFNSTGTPTNPVGLLSGLTGAPSWSDAIGGSVYSASPIKEYAYGGSAPTGKYIHLYIGAGGGTTSIVTLYGYEI